MRKMPKVLFVIGAVLAVLAGLWALIAPGQLDKYPSNLNKTAIATGELTQFLSPRTGLPLARPQVLPLTIHRHVYVVSSTSSQAVVKEDDLEQIGPLAPINLRQEYVLDRSSLKDLTSAKSWAYAPANVLSRAPAYSINLPFDTRSGPYQIWKNEVGRSYTFTQQGSAFSRDGITMIPLRGQMTNVPAQQSYLTALSSLGLPTQTTIQRLAPQLKALGLDPAQLSSVLLPKLAPADRATIQAALTQPIKLRYVVSVKTRLLVEPTTGAIVSLDNINQTLSVQPEFAALTQIGAILAKPQYAKNPVVAMAGATLAKLAQNPPTAPVFNLTYGQTPASVADFASYAKSKANKIDLVKTTIPLILLLLGLAAALGGATIAVLERRRQRKLVSRSRAHALTDAPAGAPGGRRRASPTTTRR